MSASNLDLDDDNLTYDEVDDYVPKYEFDMYDTTQQFDTSSTTGLTAPSKGTSTCGCPCSKSTLAGAVVLGLVLYAVLCTVAVVVVLVEVTKLKSDTEALQAMLPNDSMSVSPVGAITKCDNVTLEIGKLSKELSSLRDVIIVQANTTNPLVRRLGDQLFSLQQSLASQSNMTSSELEDLRSLLTSSGMEWAQWLLSNVTLMQSRLNDSNSLINTSASVYPPLEARTSSLERNISIINSSQAMFRQNLSSFQSALNASSNQLNTLSSNVSSLRSDLQNVGTFNGCLKEESTCTVVRHDRNNYWFLCNTPSRSINRSGYYTVSMDCVYRVNGLNYIDQATLRSSASNPQAVWCECDVVGLTTSGAHGSLFDPVPSGQCVLTIARCLSASNTPSSSK